MNIVILSVYPFPIGFSATNRIISYSKGLVELGNKVTNIIIRPTEKSSSLINTVAQGKYQGINFIYSNCKTQWANNPIIKIFQFLLGFVASLFLLYKLNREKQIDIIIVSIDNIFYNLSYILFSKFILQKKVIFISDEYPFVLRRKRHLYKYIPSLIKFVENFGYRFFDGIVVMTESLREYYRVKTKNKLPIELVLMTVEVERFNINKNNGNKYLAYIGDLTLEKDGVDILIRSFKKVVQIFPNYKLKIAGSTKKNADVIFLKTLVNELNLNEKVEFLGKLHRDKVPEFLTSADLLLLSRPNTDRSKGGFPTKLGEYLSTGNPVVVTRVGEIPNYLKDGFNAFLAEPDSVESFANKILEALSNMDLARQIGLRGRLVAENVFNYKVQSKVFNEFLQIILNGKVE